MVVEIPELEKISKKDWFTNYKYTFLQLKEIETLTEKHVWITAYRRKIFVHDMTTSHIRNCINCLHGEGRSYIPPGYLGGKEKWLKIFEKELSKRQ